MKKIVFLLLFYTTLFVFGNDKEKMVVNAIYLGSDYGSVYQALYLDNNKNYILINLQAEYGKSSQISEAFATIAYASICKMVIYKQSVSFDTSRSGFQSPHSQINYTIDSVVKTGKSVNKLVLTGKLTSVYLPENGKKIEIQISKIGKHKVLNGYNLQENNAKLSFDAKSLKDISNDEYKQLAVLANQDSNEKLNADLTIIPVSESYRNVYASREEDREKIHYRYFWKVESIKLR